MFTVEHTGVYRVRPAIGNTPVLSPSDIRRHAAAINDHKRRNETVQNLTFSSVALTKVIISLTYIHSMSIRGPTCSALIRFWQITYTVDIVSTIHCIWRYSFCYGKRASVQWRGLNPIPLPSQAYILLIFPWQGRWILQYCCNDKGSVSYPYNFSHIGSGSCQKDWSYRYGCKGRKRPEDYLYFQTFWIFWRNWFSYREDLCNVWFLLQQFCLTHCLLVRLSHSFSSLP